ncbi:MAG TPA: integrase core domain-containing protein [Thermodesulfobacteriota bacterium]
MTEKITDKAKSRVRLLDFFERYGLKATEEAFGVKKSSIYRWGKLLGDNGGRIEVLCDRSRAPRRRRKPEYDDRAVGFIRGIRGEYPRIGKTKIKVFLDEYSYRQGIRAVSESTIGRIIKSHRLFSHPKGISHFGKIKTTRYRKKLRRHGYRAKYPGELLQVDSIVRFRDGIKSYIITAIDLISGFAFAYGYSSLSSKSALDFFEKLEKVTPFKVRAIQTDNGSEFEKHFREHLERSRIKHFWNYPKHPQLNAKVERFNRTVQEEFIEWNSRSLFHDLESFNHKLVDWLIFYNTKRPHFSLGNIPPVKYLIQKVGFSNMLWTHTFA